MLLLGIRISAVARTCAHYYNFPPFPLNAGDVGAACAAAVLGPGEIEVAGWNKLTSGELGIGIGTETRTHAGTDADPDAKTQ